MELSLRKRYRFETYVPAILGSDFTDCTVQAIMDFDSANRDSDITVQHINILPALPSDTSRDPRAHSYVKVSTPSGISTILSMAWIRPETLELIAGDLIEIKVTKVTASDVPRIRAALTSNGFTDIEITYRQQ